MELAATRVIERPAAEVFDFFADAANNPDWQKGMVSCEWTSPSPITVGSMYRQEARFMGRPVRTTFEVTQFEPGRSITIESRESTFPISVTRRVEHVAEGRCQVDAQISGGPGGLMTIFRPLIERMAQRSVDADYDRLKVLLEASTDS